MCQDMVVAECMQSVIDCICCINGFGNCQHAKEHIWVYTLLKNIFLLHSKSNNFFCPMWHSGVSNLRYIVRTIIIRNYIIKQFDKKIGPFYKKNSNLTGLVTIHRSVRQIGHLTTKYKACKLYIFGVWCIYEVVLYIKQISLNSFKTNYN